MDQEFDFEKDMAIDPNFLDVAALEQAELAMKYSKEAAHADRVAKRAFEAVKTMRSKLIKDCTEDPDGCLGKGIKAVGATIEAYYRNNKEYRQCKNEMIDAEYRRDLVKAAADHIFFQRKKMIEVLAGLLQGSYFAGPSMPHDINEVWKEAREKRIEDTSERVGKNIPRRRRG